jgi:erythromycin esterase-like protein
MPRDRGFSHNFGRSAANRELVEWMRRHNAAQATPLTFHGFDSPTEMTHADSPRHLLAVALDFLSASSDGSVAERRKRIEELLGEDAAWEHPSSTFDASKSTGLSAAATALRIKTENMVLHTCA